MSALVWLLEEPAGVTNLFHKLLTAGQGPGCSSEQGELSVPLSLYVGDANNYRNQVPGVKRDSDRRGTGEKGRSRLPGALHSTCLWAS